MELERDIPMRSVRATRNIRSIKADQPVLGATVTVADNMVFSMFEDFTPETVTSVTSNGTTTVNCKRPDAPETKPTFTIFDMYSEQSLNGQSLPAGYTDDGLIAIEDFRNALIAKRMSHLQAIPDAGDTTPKKFNVCLLVNEKQVETEKSYQVVSIDFVYTPKDNKYNETANISVFNDMEDMTKAIPRRVKNLIVDSDQNEALIRLVKDLQWHSMTYAILDFNKNLNIDKNVHIVLDTPFNCNMNWFAPNRRLVYGYCFYEPSA